MKTITSSQEAVALSGDRTDEAGPAPVFPELFAEIANVTIHDVALGDVVGAPERIENLVPSQGLPGVRCKQIQERKLE